MPTDPPVAAAPDMDALIERCLSGDQAAWDQIVRQHCDFRQTQSRFKFRPLVQRSLRLR
jgi:hypothetical protein